MRQQQRMSEAMQAHFDAASEGWLLRSRSAKNILVLKAGQYVYYTLY